ncbi:MAG: efflux RND transporter periplasmic adaptor subunit [Emcibacter sp.]|nr:efflux RND transporter periplasmic adaptor subunit [Emcibacter sp.]
MNKQIISITVIALIVGLGLGSFLFDKPKEIPAPEKKVAYWVAPMDASYRQDKPGKSPMGMDLIPVYEENNRMSGMDDPGFKISTNVQANLGIKTALVAKQTFTPLVEATGRLAYDENKISRLQVRTEGWIEKLYVKTVGENIKKGDRLFALYSPVIATALGEYADARRGKSKVFKKLSKGRLMALGLTERTIQKALKSGNLSQAIIFYAPQDGVVTSLGVREGSIAVKNTIAFEITDPTNLWLIADVFETDSHDLNQGAHAQIIGQSGDIYHGMIDHIYPDLDPASRTVQVRINLPNPEGKLKPGQFFMVNIHGDSELSLIIPVSAVIRLGTGNHVMVSHEFGRFEAVEVELGKSSGEQVQVMRGLKEGERVVISGQFLLDSESSFTGAKLRILDQKINDQHMHHNMEDM